MQETLEALANLLETTLVDQHQVLKTVKWYSDFESSVFLRKEMLPTIILTPIGDDFSQGPIGNTGLMKLDIRIRIVLKSTDSKKGKTRPVSEPTIYQLTKMVREIILSNKTLDGKVFDMEPKWVVKDRDVIHRGQGHFTARDIFFAYRKLESYTGRRNNQVSTKVPEGMKKIPLPEGITF